MTGTYFFFISIDFGSPAHLYSRSSSTTISHYNTLSFPISLFLSSSFPLSSKSAFLSTTRFLISRQSFNFIPHFAHVPAIRIFSRHPHIFPPSAHFPLRQILLLATTISTFTSIIRKDFHTPFQKYSPSLILLLIAFSLSSHLFCIHLIYLSPSLSLSLFLFV
ncbi:unnamed protein product [Acanthosepion pharaonis]|uniref:Uncharacterized protein n=1 Tax=Acanthosepion pharaonis TaxID=158019 RepID=A0A812EFP6_ACAPH|nr:unnamed protein product [Sepia pharaonis]